MISRAAILFVVVAALACILHLACGGESHIFVAEFFVEGRNCLGTPSSVDVVTGGLPPECPARCLAQPFPDGGRVLYVATMCEPFPITFDASSSDPECPIAVAAALRDDICIADGGSTDPIEASVADAGEDAD